MAKYFEVPQLHAFDDDHFCFCRAMAHFARLAIFLRIEPILGAPHRLELEHDDAFRMPIAFENFSPPAAHNVTCRHTSQRSHPRALCNRHSQPDRRYRCPQSRRRAFREVSLRVETLSRRCGRDLLLRAREFSFADAVGANYSTSYGGCRAGSGTFG